MKQGASEQEERDLFTRAQAGDDTAYEQLWRRHWSVACRVAAKVLGNDTDADAVAARALITARSASFEPGEAPLRSWLLTIVYNRARDCLRKRRVRREREAQAHMSMHRTASGDHGRAQAWESFHACLKRLSPLQRAVLVLVDLAGKSKDEVAESLGYSTEVIEVRLAEARREMRRCMADSSRGRHERRIS